MNYYEVEIDGLSYSNEKQEFVCLLLEKGGQERRMVVLIPEHVAQLISMKKENIETPRPLITEFIHKTFIDNGLTIQSVYIYKIKNKIFYTKVVINNGHDEYEEEITTGYALSISYFFNCPIFVSDEVLNEVGVIVDKNYNTRKPEPKIIDKTSIKDKIENLNKDMEKALSTEDYEKAAKIRDEINNLKNK